MINKLTVKNFRCFRDFTLDINGASALTANTKTSELFRFIRIDQNDDRITPYIFDTDSFEYAVKNNREIK